MTLNSPSITELTTEKAPLNLLLEWLGNWFNGQAQLVGANSPIVFPQVLAVAGKSPVTQPLAGVEIRVVILPRRETAEVLNTSLATGMLVTSSVMLHFTVSAKVAGKDGAYSEEAAQTVADLLKAIVTNPAARFPLCENGFRAFQPVAINNVPSADYSKRIVTCGAQLQYPVQFGEGVAFPSDQLSLSFTNEDPLVVGDALTGQYEWDFRAVTLLSVTAAYLPSQEQDVVLGLEIGGEPSGFTLTLPQGDADIPATVASTPINLTVQPTQTVRWTVVSGPIPELSAWQVSLNVQAQ